MFLKTVGGGFASISVSVSSRSSSPIGLNLLGDIMESRNILLWDLERGLSGKVEGPALGEFSWSVPSHLFFI